MEKAKMAINQSIDYSKLKTFTLEQAAEFLQCSVKTIERSIVRGKFAPIIKPFGQKRIISEDFYSWIDEEKQRAKSIFTAIRPTNNHKRGSNG